MSYDYSSLNTLCPFYINEDKLCLTCEGILGDNNTHTVFRFKTIAARKLHKAEWCDKNYKRCEYYRALMREKYSEYYD